MHQHTMPRVVDPGKTAAVTALVTATVSSRLTSLLRLTGHHENLLTGCEASGSSDVSFNSSGVYSTGKSRRYTFHPCHVLCCRCIYFVYTNLRKENIVQRGSIHTPVCVVTVRKNIVNVLIDNSEHGNLDRESGS